MKFDSELLKALSFPRIVTAFIAIILVFCIFTSIYTVREGEIGILRTFGKITGITQPGIHFKLPYPIQQADAINMNKANVIEIGVNNIKKQKNENLQKNSMYMAGEENIIWINMTVEWMVSDPKAYLINSVAPDEILYNAIVATIRAVIGSSSIDSIMGSGKIEAQTKIKRQLGMLIEKYDIGIRISDIKIQEVRPPTQVQKYFDNVTDAMEQRNMRIAKAEDYKNQKLNAAENEALKIAAEAEVYHEEILNKAKAETMRFDGIYEQYKLGKEVTKSRLLIETLEEVLPGIDIYITDNKNADFLHFPIKESGGEER